MIIYNVTIKVDPSRNAEWLEWMRSEHLPDVMRTGFFIEHRLARLLHQDDSDGITYAVQYTCGSIQDFEQYEKDHAPRLRLEHSQRFPGNVAFRTVLKVI